jgi:hypothetical protein
LVELSLTDVPKPHEGLDWLTDLTCFPKPERSILVEGSLTSAIVAARLAAVQLVD